MKIKTILFAAAVASSINVDASEVEGTFVYFVKDFIAEQEDRI